MWISENLVAQNLKDAAVKGIQTGHGKREWHLEIKMIEKSKEEQKKLKVHFIKMPDFSNSQLILKINYYY